MRTQRAPEPAAPLAEPQGESLESAQAAPEAPELQAALTAAIGTAERDGMRDVVVVLLGLKMVARGQRLLVPVMTQGVLVVVVAPISKREFPPPPPCLCEVCGRDGCVGLGKPLPLQRPEPLRLEESPFDDLDREADDAEEGKALS